MIVDVIGTFFTTLGIIWFFLILIKLLNAPRQEPKEVVKVNGLQFDKESVMYAEAEYVEQGTFKGYLIFDKNRHDFLCQGLTKEECREELKKRFPNKTILISGF